MWPCWSFVHTSMPTKTHATNPVLLEITCSCSAQLQFSPAHLQSSALLTGTRGSCFVLPLPLAIICNALDFHTESKCVSWLRFSRTGISPAFLLTALSSKSNTREWEWRRLNQNSSLASFSWDCQCSETQTHQAVVCFLHSYFCTCETSTGF